MELVEAPEAQKVLKKKAPPPPPAVPITVCPWFSVIECGLTLVLYSLLHHQHLLLSLPPAVKEGVIAEALYEFISSFL